MSEEDAIDEDDDLDEEEDEDEDGESENETPFDDETEGRLVAGRCFELGGMTMTELTALKHAVDAIAERTTLALDVVPGGDFTSTGPGPDEDVHGSCVIGLSAGRGGTYTPDAVEREAALEKLEAAKKIGAEVWKEIAELVSEKARESFRKAKVDLWLACVGPLAAATLVFGVEGDEDASGMPGKYHGGQNMDQEPFDTGVWGLRVTYVQYESPEVERVDLSDKAHARRVEKLGRDDGRYFLVARYD